MRFSGIIILVLLAITSKGQLADSLASKLLKQEELYWQAKDDSTRFTVLLNKAKTDRYAGLYDNAINELYRAEDVSKNKHETAQLKYEKMLNYFLSDNYNACSQVTIDTRTGIPYKNYLFMKLCSFNESEKWDSCKELLLAVCDKKDTIQTNKITALPVKYKYKSPVKSRKMSNILPGLGEVYAGYPFKGFTSFILNAGFLFFAGYNYYLGYYITGTVSGIFPVLKFHAGGKRLSAILADEHNEMESRKLKNKYWEEINSLEQ